MSRVLENISEVRDYVRCDGEVKLIYVSSETCNVCHAMLPKIITLVSEYERIQFAEVVAERVPLIAGEYNILSAPTLVIYMDGKEMKRFAGIISLDDVKVFFDKIL